MYLVIRIVFLVIFCEKMIESSTLQPNVTNNMIKYAEPKIVGGRDATLNGTEHIVSIRLKNNDYNFGRGHNCGGALINSTTVLTAAHCLFNVQSNPPKIRKAREFQLVMGTLDKTKKTPQTFVTDVTKIILHQNFSIHTMENDIGLMIFSKPIPNYPTIKSISLAHKLPPTGTKCRVDGWGALRSGSSGPKRLQTVNITILDKNTCNRNYQGRLRKGMFCAGDWNGGKDSCQGDSGGPVTCNGILVGIVSWGDKCGFPNLPGIYSDVGYFENWIRTTNTAASNLSNQNLIRQIFYYIIFLITSIFILN